MLLKLPLPPTPGLLPSDRWLGRHLKGGAACESSALWRGDVVFSWLRRGIAGLLRRLHLRKTPDAGLPVSLVGADIDRQP